MKRTLIITAFASLVIVLAVLQAGASLVPMSCGFPQMTQSSTLTAFEKDTALATDDEASAISFGATASSLTDSVFGSSLPTISQTAAQSNLLSSVKFQNENSNFAYAYPFLSIGNSPLPSMGFI